MSVQRSDVDDVSYADTGCDVHPSCLSCPLVRCRYEVAGGVRALRNRERDAKITRLRAQGLTGPQVAEQMGVSLRTVMRAGEARRAS